ncbi:mannosyltransferase [Sistotremastrum suecicum HHB10207 ss-3]|uniref:GDP-Man:Man(3)GlcNAc(2)-PP-Dol alpha-1,2-mannosyltransferase n=1 Tax=Sistotremastrum suecicum HHB10207 ss-3 TaxID=1314776 RepID=A0A166ETQ1_9AGAM|nr:mannosyltransferase [Sistotremastrum suecicum HHB10207 ss-3]
MHDPSSFVVPLLLLLLPFYFGGSVLYLVSRWVLRGDEGRRQRVLKSLAEAGYRSQSGDPRLVGFFHPYCNAGGGGERVLWTAISFFQRTEPDVVNVVYTGDVGVSKEKILANVKDRFNVALDPRSIHFVFLKSRGLVEDSAWPMFTLLGQSLGSMYLVWEAITQLVPDLYIDTMGYAFTFHVVRLLCHIPVGAYVHYPTISTEMLKRVRTRTAGHTNSGSISSSKLLSSVKLLYYRLFMFCYSRSLRKASFLMVNSTWTKNHVDAVLHHKDPLLSVFAAPLLYLLPADGQNWELSDCSIVYPPCDTSAIVPFKLEGRSRMIVSIAQFRPEKDHPAQLRAFAALLKSYPEYRDLRHVVRLVLIGSVRNHEDEARVAALRRQATDLGIENQIEIVVNAPFPLALDYLSRASIGLSTMRDEHFGINVVEFMGAGVIPVVHASGGPLHDIVVPYEGGPTGELCTGYHAASEEEFADCLHEALKLSGEAAIQMRSRARKRAVDLFSEAEFEKGWAQTCKREYYA